MVSNRAFVNAVITHFGFESLEEVLEYSGSEYESEAAAFIVWEDFEKNFKKDPEAFGIHVHEFGDGSFLLHWEDWTIAFGDSEDPKITDSVYWNIQNHGDYVTALEYLQSLGED